MTGKNEYCSTVPRTFVHDCSLWFCGLSSLVLIFAVIGHNKTKIPEIFKVFTFLVVNCKANKAAHKIPNWVRKTTKDEF